MSEIGERIEPEVMSQYGYYRMVGLLDYFVRFLKIEGDYFYYDFISVKSDRTNWTHVQIKNNLCFYPDKMFFTLTQRQLDLARDIHSDGVLNIYE